MAKAQIYVYPAELYMSQASELLHEVFAASDVVDALKSGREMRVAVVQDEVVGFISFDRKINYGYWDLHWLASSEEYRGRGVGRVLVDYMRAYVVLHGGYAVRVETPADIDAGGFYSRLGFDHHTSYAHYYDAGRSVDVYVWRNPSYAFVDVPDESD